MLPRSVSPLPLGSDLPPLRVFGRPRRSDSPAPPLDGGSCGDGAGQQTYIDLDGYTTSVEGEGTVHHHNQLPDADGQHDHHQQHQHQQHQQQQASSLSAQRPYASPFSPPHQASASSYAPSASLSALAHSKLMDPFSSGIVGFPMMATARGGGGDGGGADRSTRSPSPPSPFAAGNGGNPSIVTGGGPLPMPAHPPSMSSLLWSADSSLSSPSTSTSMSMARYNNLFDGFEPHATTSFQAFDRSMAPQPLPLQRDYFPSSGSSSPSLPSLPPPLSSYTQPSPSPSLPSASNSTSSFQPLPDYGSWIVQPLGHCSPSTATTPSDAAMLHSRERFQHQQQQHHQQQHQQQPAQHYGSLQRPAPSYYSPTTTTTTSSFLPGRAGGRPSGPGAYGSFVPPLAMTTTPTAASAGRASPPLHFTSGASPSSVPSPMCPSNTSPRAELPCPDFQLNLPNHHHGDSELIEEVYLFVHNYKAHSRELHRTAREGQFALAHETIARFWPMTGRFQRLMSLHTVIEQIIRFDKLFYEALVEAAVASIDNCRIDSARAVLDFAQALPSWTFHAASRSLPPSLFHPKMTLLKRNAREMMLRAQIAYYSGLLAAVFNERFLERSVGEVLADPYLYLAGSRDDSASIADAQSHTEQMSAKRPRISDGADGHGGNDNNHLHRMGGFGEESSNDAWGARRNTASDASNPRHFRFKQESDGAAGSANLLKRSRGARTNGDTGDEAALVTQRMFDDWNNLDTQSLVTGMMRQHGAVWSVITFSPVLVMRLIADQLERKARLEHWFASFVESHLIKELLLDQRDTGSGWYATIPFANKDTLASPSNAAAAKPLSDSHVFYMQWRCFSSQVLWRLESNRASTATVFSILFAWIDALLDFVLDKRRAHFLSLSATKRTTSVSTATMPEIASASAGGSTNSNGRPPAPHFPPSSVSQPVQERNGSSAIEQPYQQPQHHFQHPGGWNGGAAMPPDLRQQQHLAQSSPSHHHYHELRQQHHQQQMYAMMSTQQQQGGHHHMTSATATSSSPSATPSPVSRVPSSPGGAGGYRTPLSPGQPPPPPPPVHAQGSKRQPSPKTPTTPSTLTSHLFQFKQKPSSSSSTTQSPAGSSQPSPGGAAASSMSPLQSPSSSSSLPTVPSKLRSPSEVMSQLGLPQSLLARMQHNVATSTPIPAAATAAPTPTSTGSTVASASANVSSDSSSSYSSESSPSGPSSPASPPPRPSTGPPRLPQR